MAYCSKCGKKVNDDAEFCVHCGCRLKGSSFSDSSNKNLVRFLLTFFLGFLGSFIVNHTDLKPEGWKSRTCAYFFLGIVTIGIYDIVASICNFNFDPKRSSNIGYFKK